MQDLQEVQMIEVVICDDCGKPWFGRKKSTDRCGCDPSSRSHVELIPAEEES